MSDKPTIIPKGRFRLKYRGTECLNCRHPLDMSDKYCPNCSQANSTKKLTIKDFFDEFFSNIIDYDSKVLKTLFALLLRPGLITLDYIKGKRVSYTNPFRFLLSLAVIYFVLLEFTGNFDALDNLGLKNNEIPQELNSSFEIDLDRKLKKESISETVDSLSFTDRINTSIANKDALIMDNPRGHFNTLKDRPFLARLNGKQQFFKTLIRRDTAYNIEDVVKKYAIEETMENRVTFSAGRSLVRISEQPGAFASSVISKLPFATFFFLPIFAVFISLAYSRKKYTYTDNLIFSFHNQALLFILLIISFLVDNIFNINSSGLFLLVFLFYLYKAMRKFYKQGRFKTILKFMFLNTIFFILANVAALLLIIGSAFTY